MIPSTTNESNGTGDDTTATYPYSFKIFAETDLVVTLRLTSSGAETLLTLTTDYTVTGVGETLGGNIVLVDSDQAWLSSINNFLEAGYTINIRRIRPHTQNTDVRNQGDFYPESHEDKFDDIAMQLQQLRTDINKSIRVSNTVPAADFDPLLPTDITDKAASAILVNNTGDGLTLGSVVSSGALTVSAYIATLLDDATAALARVTLGFAGASGTVQAANIEADAVTTPKIIDDAVTTAKINDNAVTAAKVVALGDIQYYTSSDTWTKPANLAWVYVTIIGGGGGGGGVDGQGSGTWGHGGGGGGGSTAKVRVPAASLGATETVTIGAAGAGGAGTGPVNGSAGGTSTFGALASAGGGAGGSNATGSSSFLARPGGSGGTATVGDLLLYGYHGDFGVAGAAGSSGAGAGGGGGSSLAGGARGTGGDTAGNSAPATAYGGGGAGGSSTNVTTNYSGGSGAAGLCIVEEFFT